ncbi:MAG: hypothetical protein DRP84_11690 [Spirochaetes bacterium]|nr:MAG: hypothetical protein DRP84_11690 [Spirochaetota bacterium]RKX97886.1 MAG: hypothetical protein DRP55_08580 [Spirochaetota bacterium]
MSENRRVPELVLPAGSFEKLRYAIAYGADAVYAGPSDSSLRANMNDFNIDNLKDAILYTHNLGKKIYVTLNLFAHEGDLTRVKRYAEELSGYKPDAFIISDPGILNLLRNKIKTDIPIHLSTQMNTTNSESIKFWSDMGVNRVILAREITFEELNIITQNIGKNIELEIFVHGAMCVSYSGRCLLSNFLSGRDSNRGECNQPCRWRYYLVEETRPNQKFEIVENQRGTYILNSKDLILIDKLEELSCLKLNAYKVEGRTKNIFYLSLIALAYRTAIDEIYGIKTKNSKIDYLKLVNLTDNHGFTHGFLFDDGEIKQNVHDRNFKKQKVLGYVIDIDKQDGLLIKVKNPIRLKDKVLGITPDGIETLTITRIKDIKGNVLKEAYGSKGDIVWVEFDKEIAGDNWKYGIISSPE